MDHQLYQRPREKLHDKGPRALSIVELIQIILGSGSAKVSVAKIARHVEKLFVEDKITYEALTSISGMGEAKACQILAALELSRRVAPGG